MSEIRDKVEKQIAGILKQPLKIDLLGAKAKGWKGIKQSPDMRIAQILSITELAVVDREAVLPENPRLLWEDVDDIEKAPENQPYYAYAKAQQDMLNAHYVKEIKE